MENRTPTRLTQAFRPLTLVAVAALALGAVGCSSGGEDAAEVTTTTVVVTTTTTEAEATTTTEKAPRTTTTIEEPDDTTVRGKTILLDGFIGVAIPAGWSVTSQETPRLSSTPGPETELDDDALVQALVLNPDDSPRGATFSLVHYEHSDRVPSLDLFGEAIVDLLAGDGSQIGEADDVTIGGQDGYLHQVTSASGANGVLVIFESGGEYFFIISIVSDTDYATDAGELLASLSFEPDALSA